MPRNLPLVFALSLGGALLVEHGAKAFGSVLHGGQPSAGARLSDAGLTPAGASGAIGQVTPAMLQDEAARYGWTADQVDAWRWLIGKESGGSTTARNPSSGAFGIGQFLGDTLREYTPFGAASHDAGAQLHAMAKYIHDRYGSPAAAKTFHEAHNWY